MSLDAIIGHILAEASAQKEEILAQARQEQARILNEAQQEASRLYEGLLEGWRRACEHERQKVLVAARLEAKKGLLGVKQELIAMIFEELRSQAGSKAFKKEQVLQQAVREVAADPGLYLEGLRLESEAEIARILFS